MSAVATLRDTALDSVGHRRSGYAPTRLANQSAVDATTTPARLPRRGPRFALPAHSRVRATSSTTTARPKR